MSFDQEKGISTAEFDKAVAERRPVLRWIYHCAGVHDRLPGDEEEVEVKRTGNEQPRGDEEEESETEDEGIGQGGENVEEVDENADADPNEDYAGELRTRWKRCSDGVKLRVSATYDKPSRLGG